MQASDNSYIFQTFVLYVSMQDCPGSQRAIAACETFKEDVKIIDVKDLARPLPEWLTGTPTVVSGNEEGMVARRGTEALLLLENFVAEERHLEIIEEPSLQDSNEPISDRLDDNKITEQDIESIMKERNLQLPDRKIID